MIKVLIADDELKICDLIFNLINWSALNMSVIAVAHDGRETIKIIKSELPDIVITDIRMPGYNGVDVIKIGKEYNPDIQFIIISGYSRFDYAQNAIHYGVSDYLLKPIKENELMQALLKIKKNIDKNNQVYNQINNAKFLEQQNKKFYREELIKNLCQGILDIKNKEINDVNQQYRYNFLQATFNILIIKADGLNFNEKSESSFLYEKISQSFSFAFSPIMHEFEGVMEENGSYVFLLNYEQEYETELEIRLKKLLNQMLLQKDVFRKLHLTMGIGESTKNIMEIGHSYETAYLAIKERLLLGTDRIIMGIKKVNIKDYKDYFVDAVKSLDKAVENLNDTKIPDIIISWGESILKDSEINGYQIEQSAKALVNCYILAMKRNNYTIDKETELLQSFLTSVENCISINDILNLLKKIFVQSLSEFRHNRVVNGTKPIRDAKEYIRMNLASNLTILEVSEHVGYSSAHFSVRFKEECGITFSDYVLESRIEKAKELLRNTRETIENIAVMVGYSDVKSFTKNFKKCTEVKPSEYRKIYG